MTDTAIPTAPRADQPSALTRAMRITFLGIMLLLSGLALTQFFLVGLSLFESAAYWLDHRNVGHVFGIVTYIASIPAVLGNMGRNLIGASVVLVVMAHLQYAFIGIDSGVVNALHPLNGSLILALSLWMTSRAIASLRVTTAVR
jgi:uncharacterized membrane protein